MHEKKLATNPANKLVSQAWGFLRSPMAYLWRNLTLEQRAGLLAWRKQRSYYSWSRTLLKWEAVYFTVGWEGLASCPL